MNPKTLIFIGRSGSGKGTQVKMLSEYFDGEGQPNSFHLESGQRFRNFIKGENYSSQLAKEISEEGGLQPEFLSVWVWTSELIENMNAGTNLYIDGTPRRLAEAKILESALNFYNRQNVDIIYLNVSREWAKNRMQKRGRADDVEDADIVARLNWFDDEVVPVLDYYRSHKSYNFHDINGEQEIEKVHQDIVASLH